MADKHGDKKAAQAESGLPEVDILLRGLLSLPGVEGFMVYNESGIPIKWSTAGFVKPGMNTTHPIPPSVTHHSTLIADLTDKAHSTCVRLLGPEEGEVQSLRLKTKDNEMIITPRGDTTLVVLQQNHSAPMPLLVAAGEPKLLEQTK